MRVLQLIDSLRPGGAERMAVTYANSLCSSEIASYLCCTRMEGSLLEDLDARVNYLYLKKKNTLDFPAFLRLKKFVDKEKIQMVHAHSSSFFLAGLLKMAGCNIKLVWHDHYGESEYLRERNYKTLQIFSHLFDGIISVNTSLKNWALEYLHCSNVIELNNFPGIIAIKNSEVEIMGSADDFRILCVANLRPQKDHVNLIEAFENVAENIPASLHLVGADPKTEYSSEILTRIKESRYYQKIYYYKSLSDVYSIMKQSDLGVLSSKSEGLPVSLLEYGFCGLPVISTNVGNCGKVIGENGILVPPENKKKLTEAILEYYHNEKRRKGDAEKFNTFVKSNYSAEVVLPKLTGFYKYLLK
ncbi:glycosyltransferase [Zunongwangia sp. H14]|uniref:glycosyltransferase n=1 Tax=Zunongwangia sp. H14 TaxID=3240792 RepID=UPI00356811FB